MYTFDQTATPSNPAIGDTWRERSVTNVPIGWWYWNGTYWLSEQTYNSGSYDTASITATTTTNLTPRIGSGLLLEVCEAHCNIGTNSGTAFYNITFLSRSGATFSQIGNIVNTSAFTANTDGLLTVTPVAPNNYFAHGSFTGWGRTIAVGQGSPASPRINIVFRTRIVR